MARKAKKRKKVSPVGCLAWFALILLVIVVFFLMRSTIARAMDSSGLAELFGGGRRSAVATPQAERSTEAVAERSGDTPAGPEEAADPAAVAVTAPRGATQGNPPTEASQEPNAGSAAPQVEDSSPEARQPGARQPAAREPAAREPAAREPLARQPTARPAPAPSPATRTRQSALYFVNVSADGGISLASLTRRVAYVDSPLADTLRALIEGPLPSEEARGFRSLIPEGTRVENVYVQGDTAFVSFNEPFRFNPFGRDGLEAQLRQVVYTVTEFSNVRRVQIMIGGKVTEYLGPEGIRIRDPLSRESLTEESR